MFFLLKMIRVGDIMETEEMFLDKLKTENRCVKIRNSIDYCADISNGTENMEVVERL